MHANAWKSGSAEDNFNFEYSNDGNSYSPLFTVSSTDSANEEMALLSGGVGGTVYVRATDTDRTRGNRNIEQLYVDHLYIQVESGSLGNPPVAPANLNAVAMSASQVDMSWTDMSGDEFGFDIERSTDGSSWQPIAMAPANSSAYSDQTVSGDTFYYYRANAMNAAGASAWDGPVTVADPGGHRCRTRSQWLQGQGHPTRRSELDRRVCAVLGYIPPRHGNKYRAGWRVEYLYR